MPLPYSFTATTDSERISIVRNTEPEYRLPNLPNIVPKDQLHNIVKVALESNLKNITIYRGVPPGVTDIRPGDWVALTKGYAQSHAKSNGTVISKRVPIQDVAWAGTDKNEYYYAPQSVTASVPQTTAQQRINYYLTSHNRVESSVNLATFEDFSNSLKKLTKSQLDYLQQIMNKLNAPPSGFRTLYHGTTDKIAKIIKESGFVLTKGVRSGFLGAVRYVDNQGVFLTDSKRLATYFGDNRSDYDHEIIICYVDPSKIMDYEKPNKKLVDLGIRILNDDEHTNIKKIPVIGWWKLLDIPEFVNAIKSLGYTGVKFRESYVTRKESSDANAYTYMVFDPNSILVQKPFNIKLFYEWLNLHPHILDSLPLT